MTAGVIGVNGRRDLLGAARHALPAPADPRLVRDAARLLVATVLVLLALVGMAASGTYLAGPLPAEGPARGLDQ